MFNFYFLEKRLGLFSPPYFVYDFSVKQILMLYLINQMPLVDCLYFLRYWARCVLQLFIF